MDAEIWRLIENLASLTFGCVLAMVSGYIAVKQKSREDWCNRIHIQRSELYLSIISDLSLMAQFMQRCALQSMGNESKFLEKQIEEQRNDYQKAEERIERVILQSPFLLGSKSKEILEKSLKSKHRHQRNVPSFELYEESSERCIQAIDQLSQIARGELGIKI